MMFLLSKLVAPPYALLRRLELRHPGVIVLGVPLGWLHRDASLRLLFSGGNGSLFRSDATEADLARRFHAEQGINPERLHFESRSTPENARDVRIRVSGLPPDALASGLPHRYPRQMERLVASAQPCPLGVALHEWLGLFVYRLTRPTTENR
jgi:hypothetical protein